MNQFSLIKAISFLFLLSLNIQADEFSSLTCDQPTAQPDSKASDFFRFIQDSTSVPIKKRDGVYTNVPPVEFFENILIDCSTDESCTIKAKGKENETLIITLKGESENKLREILATISAEKVVNISCEFEKWEARNGLACLTTCRTELILR